MIFQLIKYLRRRNPRPSLPSQLVSPYKGEDVGLDDALLLMARAARDLRGLARLRQKHPGKTAPEIIHLLPKRPRTPLKKRLLRWLQRLEGSSASDPHAQDFKPEKSIRGIRHMHLRGRTFF